MTERYIFHLSFPVLDLQQTRDFYVETLGADVGRESDEWLDILLWGHQITMQYLPDVVLADGEQGKRHFGVIMPWREFNELVTDLQTRGIGFYQEPRVINAGEYDEQAKFYLKDPAHNLIEIKAYRDFDSTLNQQKGNYNY
jgi:extradiol dioxygenase family protein